MRKLRTLDEVEEEYFREHPEEINIYIEEMFAAYAQDGNTAALLSSLRVVAKVKGISDMADKIGITRQGLQKALSAKGNPRLDTINGVMNVLGYQLTPEPLRDLQAQ